ncbi:MAG: hypothetical protein JWO38_7179 [Gemmataceae bacterium]|nr:hypothetical protein [Gemmataceae bacterium]
MATDPDTPWSGPPTVEQPDGFHEDVIRALEKAADRLGIERTTLVAWPLPQRRSFDRSRNPAGCSTDIRLRALGKRAAAQGANCVRNR